MLKFRIIFYIVFIVAIILFGVLDYFWDGDEPINPENLSIIYNGSADLFNMSVVAFNGRYVKLNEGFNCTGVNYNGTLYECCGETDSDFSEIGLVIDRGYTQHFICKSSKPVCVT